MQSHHPVKSFVRIILMLALGLLMAVEGKPSDLLDWHPSAYGHEHVDLFEPHHYHHHHHALPLTAGHHETLLPAAALPIPPVHPPVAPLLHTHLLHSPAPLPVPVPAALPGAKVIAPHVEPLPVVAPAPIYRAIAGPKITTHHVSLGYALPKATFSKVLAPAPLARLPYFHPHHHHHHHALF